MSAAIDEELVLRPGRTYPVISVSLEAVENALGDQGMPFDFHGQGLEALEAVVARKRTPVRIAIWAREGTGYDRANRPAQLLYLSVVAPRDGGQLSEALRNQLNMRWADQCRMEGNYEPVGGERPLWELSEKVARRST